MSKPASISVVIPAYNEEKFLPSTLQALLKQSKFPQEIIVVNNASTDDTRMIAQSFIEKFKNKKVNLRVIDELEKGVAKTRNRGFNEAKNEIIASTDADSQPHPDWIMNIEKHFLEKDSVAVTGSIIMTDAIYPFKVLTKLGYYQFLNFVGKTFMGFRSVHTANAAFRKKYFLKCNGFNEEITSPLDNDDFEISSRLVALGPIRFDSKLKVDGSFRRYSSFTKICYIVYRRCRAWLKISLKRKK